MVVVRRAGFLYFLVSVLVFVLGGRFFFSEFRGFRELFVI